MSEMKSVRTLKKQLMAAIAMVMVAAVALASSTYAWFVSNNSVEATTTNISAQSNAAYLVIDNAAAGATSTSSTSSTTASEAPTDTKLYPAQVIADGVWQSAYASAANASTENNTTRFTIGTGTADNAVSADYALKNIFYIGTGTYDGVFSDLKVQSVEVTSKARDAYTLAQNTNTGYVDEDTTYAYLTGTTPATSNDYITKNAYNALPTSSGLVDAVRVLIKCGDNWVVWQNGSQVTTYNNGTETSATLTGQATDGVLASSVVKGTDETVEVYLYYDGADTNVYSNNLANLSDCGVNITFTATPTQYGVGA